MQRVKKIPVRVRVKKTTLFSCFEKEKSDEPAVCLNEEGMVQLRDPFERLSVEEIPEDAEGAFNQLTQIFDRLTGADAPTELSTFGTLSASTEEVKLEYSEFIAAEDNALQTLALTVNAAGVAVLVCSVGKETRDFLVFEKGKKHAVSTWMDRPVVLHTLALDYWFCQDEGRFSVLYDTEIGGSVVEKNELSLQIVPQNEK